MRIFALRAAVIAVVIAIWQVMSGPILDPYFVSSPSRIASDLWEGFTEGTLLSDVGITMLEAAIGLVVGMIAGIVAGIAFAFWPTVDKIVEPILGAINALPRPALAPLFVLWFGLGMTSKVLVALSLVFFVAFYNAYQGVKSIDQDVVNAVRVMKAGRKQLLTMVVLPAVFTWVFAAFKLSVGYALVGAIVGEFVGSTSGLGYQLTQAQGLLDTDRVFAIVILTGILASVVLFLADRAESRLLKWRPQVSMS